MILHGFGPTLVDKPPSLVFWEIENRSGLEDFSGIFDSPGDEDVQSLPPPGMSRSIRSADVADVADLADDFPGFFSIRTSSCREFPET